MTKQKSPSAESSSNNPNASRLRDNQRRSRARKKEYVATLEAKYQECQRMGVEASIEIQNAARAVVRENTRLKELLRKVGMRNDEIEKWIAEGGLETGAVDRVQCGLGRRPCPSLEGGIAKTGSRAEILGRRSSTGGMLMKVNNPPPALPRRASIMPDSTVSPMLPSRTTVPANPSPLKTPLQLQTSLYPSSQNPTSYPTSSTTTTPASTTSSHFNQATSIPLARSAVTSPSTSLYNNSQQLSPLHIAPSTSLTSSTNSPSIIPGAVAGWNNFQIQPQLPPPAVTPTMLNALVQAQQQQHQAQQHRLQAENIRSLHQLQQQPQQQYEQYTSQIVEHVRTPCNIASSIIQQFHPDGIPAEIQEELCPRRPASHNCNSPAENHHHPSFSFPLQQQQEQGSSDSCCSDDMASCSDNGQEDHGDHSVETRNNDYDNDGNGVPMDGMESSTMGVSGVSAIDLSRPRGCGSTRGRGQGQDSSLAGCSVDNVALFGMLSRMVG